LEISFFSMFIRGNKLPHWILFLFTFSIKSHYILMTQYSRILLHCVFSVKGNQPHIHPKWKESLYRKIGFLIKEQECKLFIVNGEEDHVHVFFSMPPKKSCSMVMKFVKAKSSKWINENKLCPEKFYWQQGYGVLSVSNSHFDKVYHYIKNQKE